MPYIGNIVQDFSVNTAMLNTDSVTSIKIDDGTIVNADISDSAAIAMSKLALSITNSEINASAAIAGTKIDPSFTSNVTISNSAPRLNLTDTGGNDFMIIVDGNDLNIQDTTAGQNRLNINSSGTVSCNFGLAVTGNITTTSGNLTVDGEGSVEDVFKISDQAGGQRLLMGNRDSAGVDCPRIFNVGNAALTIGIGDSWSGDGGTLTSQFTIAKNGTITSVGNHDFSAGIDVTGAITGTGDMTIDTNTLHVDSSNDKVGIGTTSPGQKLGVAGNIRFESADPTLEFNNGGAMVYARAANTLQFATGGGPSSPQEKMQIDSSGRVQIGSTNNSSTGTKLVVGSGNNIAATALINTQDTDINALTLSNWDGATTSNKVLIGFDSSGRGSFSLGMPASTNAFAFFGSIDGSSNERMRIDGDGTIFSFSPNDTTPNIKWRSDDTNWFGSLNQSVEGATISTFLSTGGDWSANGTTYSATKAIANFETRAIVLHPQFNNGAGKVAFLQKAAGSTTTDGAVTEILSIDNAGIKFGASGAGIDFSATSDASGMTSELLDDYEEGTYTPALLGSTTNPTVNYTNQQGRYTKIGNLIYVTFDLTYDSKSADGSGILYVSLPLNVNGASVFHIAHLRGSRCSAFPTTVTKFAATHAIIPGTNFFEPNTNDGSGGFGVIQGSNLNSSGRVVGGAVYLAA